MLERLRKLFSNGYAKIGVLAVLFLTAAAAFLFITGKIATGAAPNLWTITYIGPQTLITGEPARLSYLIRQYSGNDPNIIVPVTTLGGVTVYNSAHNLSCETGGRVEAGGIVTCMFVINVPAGLSGTQTLSTRFDMYRVSDRCSPETPVSPGWNDCGAYGGTIDTGVSVVSGAGTAPVCNDRQASMNVICGSTNPVPAATPDSGCQISRYENFTPTTLSDGSTITYNAFPPPGNIIRNGGSCVTPPGPLTTVRFKVVENSPTGPFVGGAQPYLLVNGVETQATPVQDYTTSATDQGGGYNLIKGPTDIGGQTLTFNGVKFKKDGYSDSSAQDVSAVPGATRDYTFVLNRLLFDYTISAADVTVTRGQTNSSLVSLRLVPGRPSQAVTLTFFGIPNGTNASWAPGAVCSPTCSRTLSIATSAQTPIGSHTITVTGQPLGKTATFTLTVNAPGGDGSPTPPPTGTGTPPPTGTGTPPPTGTGTPPPTGTGSPPPTGTPPIPRWIEVIPE